MRVLFFLGRGSLPICGLCANLQEKDVDVLASYHPGSFAQNQLATLGVPGAPLRIRSRFNPFAYPHITELVDRFSPDIIHIIDQQALLPVLWATRRNRNLPLVVDRGAVRHPSHLHPLHRLIYFNNRIACFAAWSNPVRDALIESGVYPERTRTLYFGHDPSWYEQESRDLRQELHLSPSTFLAGFVGKIRPVKGFDILVTAIALLPPHTDFKVIVFGEDAGGRGLAMARRAGVVNRFIFLGHRPKAFRWMQSLNCVIIPSRSEGMPKVAIEAMSLRRPVIATNVGGLPEVIDHEINGLLIPPESPQALAAMLLKLQANPTLLLTLGEKARQKIESSFSMRTTTQQFLLLYQQLITSRSGNVELSNNNS